MSSDASATVIALGDGRYQLVRGEQRRLAYAVRKGERTWVFIDGDIYVVGETDSTASHRRHYDAAALAAPMPATVVAVNVAAGQTVKAGDVLVTLEAMKMELAITAPVDGTVRQVACRAGELVQPGTPLVQLDPH